MSSYYEKFNVKNSEDLFIASFSKLLMTEVHALALRQRYRLRIMKFISAEKGSYSSQFSCRFTTLRMLVFQRMSAGYSKLSWECSKTKRILIGKFF